jgi:hypothetical protein
LVLVVRLVHMAEVLLQLLEAQAEIRHLLEPQLLAVVTVDVTLQIQEIQALKRVLQIMVDNLVPMVQVATAALAVLVVFTLSTGHRR